METIIEQTAPHRNRSASRSITTSPRGNAAVRKLLFGIAVGVVPIGIGAVATLLRSRRAGLIAGGTSALLLGVARWQLERSFNDEPDFTVAERIGRLEIREYRARVEAETKIDDTSVERSLDVGFDRLAGFIFGANERREKLGMTTPVTVRPAGDATRIAFVMPMRRTRDSLPMPDDQRITTIDIPERRVAVLSFTGKRSDALIRRKQDELRRLVAEAGLVARGEPQYAGFDPPWTLPVLRRNEVWLELA
ncbi:MAG TPA: heme-binding protein [Kofleriaceae bacterium]